ncbi:MAG: SBBP repeat-containing protein [Chloracidobacterium sp.]|nr:SBBP repeat-containing protein [Chloracidobacterium sp.]
MSKYLIIIALFALSTFYVGSHLKLSTSPDVNDNTVNEQSAVQNIKSADKSNVDALTNKQRASQTYGRLPIHFEPNAGQTAREVDYVARGNGYSLFLTPGEATLSLLDRNGKNTGNISVVKMSLNGANKTSKVAGLDALEGRSNYLLGNDPEKWQTDVANYGKVQYDEIYPGIDLVYYGDDRQLEYDFVVKPAADPRQIKLTFSGTEKPARIDAATGDLLLATASGELRQHKPFVYQDIDGERHEIASSYKLDGNSAGILLGAYDNSRELVIDPILSYGSYLGGSGFDEGRGIAVDADGNAYVVGTATSLNFPTTAGVIKTTNLPSSNNVQWNDAFVTKINPTGTAMVWSTYYGGRNGSEIGTGVAVTSTGEILISGTTMASDFPTVNAYQSTFGGTDDAFAAKLNSTGSAIVYSTYLGGNNTDTGGRIALDRTSGDAVFAGFASSPNFPTTAGAYKEKLCSTPQGCSGIFYSGSYVVKLTAAGNGVYSTLFDAGISDATLDANNNAVIGGSVSTTAFVTTPGAFQTASSGGIEGFIAKLNPTGNALVYATYLGGGFQSDRVNGVTIDAAGNLYATGQTENTGFPVTAGSFDQTFNGGEDGFLTKLDPTGSTLIYSTFFGGQGKDQPFAIALGADNSAIIAGETLSGASFPLRNSLLGTAGSIFLTRFNTDANALVYSTLLGQGGAYGLAVDGASNAYITGHTVNVIITPDSFQPDHGAANSTSSSSSAKDAFVLKVATGDEDATSYAISGTVTDDNFGVNNNYSPIVVTITGTVNRSYTPGNSGGGTVTYYFGNLPAGGNYTVTARRIGYVADPESVVFDDLGANQFADFHILTNQAPEGIITSPTHGTNYNAPATINIQATASDPDGNGIQKVDFIAYNSTTGSIPLGTDTTAPYEFTWSNIPIGTYALYAIPTDSLGLRGQSMQTVHVFVIDGGSPAVNFISPVDGQTYVEGDYVQIRMSVSSSITLVQVRDQNNNLVAWLPGGSFSTTWRVMNIGDYTLTATASTAQGQTATAVTHVTVGPINHRISGTIVDSITNAPLSGVNLALVCPSNPNITAQATTDSNGSYLFTDLGTTPNDGITITPSLAGYTFDPPSRSTGFLGYIDWPNQNYTAIRSTSITVTMTSPTNGQVFPAPANFNLAADASSNGGTITKVEFFRQGASAELLGTDITAPFELPMNNLPEGNYWYFARATDSTNGVADSTVVNITVNPAPTSVQLHGEVHNPGGGPMVGILVRLTGTANGNPVSQTWTTNVNGSYLFNVPFGGDYTITPEGTNLSFTPPSATFTNVTQDIYDIYFVASAPNQAPAIQINSPADGAVFTMPVAIPVNVTASDSDGQVIHLSMTAQSSTMSTTIGQANNGTLSFLWQPNLPGAYTLWAEARDNGGLRTLVSIAITVNQPSAVSLTGRIVDRSSVGIEGVTAELRDWATENTVIGTAITDANGVFSIANIPTFSNYVLRVAKQDYTFSPQKRVYFNLASSQTTADFTGTSQVQPSDFDGDGRTDIAVWRPSTGMWYVSRSADQTYSASQFGGAAFGDVVVPGNYDGDKKIDYAVFRNGIWYVQNSSNNQYRTVHFGLAGDRPVPGDYDGDGKTDIAVWRPSNGFWYIMFSSNGAFDYRNFGLNGDIPVAGDYDGDGISDVAVWRPSNGTWYVHQSTNGVVNAYPFGLANDMPLTGDFDGDKKIDFAVFRPSDGNWYVLQSSNGIPTTTHWGMEGDKPVAGDYDHDGKTDFAIFRPSNGTWYVNRASSGRMMMLQFGISEDIPIPGAFLR